VTVGEVFLEIWRGPFEQPDPALELEIGHL